MESSTKRKVGAIALIAAGIGAFLVPFLLHGPALQASNNGGGNTNNSGGTTGTTSPTGSTNPSGSGGNTCTSNCTTGEGPGSGSNPGTCTDSSDTSHQDNGKHLAKGHDKGNDDKSLIGKANHIMAALHKHNPGHDETHSTKTDNHTTKSHDIDSSGHSDNDDSGACADSKGNDDDQGEDD